MLHVSGERSAVIGGELNDRQLDVLWDVDLQQEEVGGTVAGMRDCSGKQDGCTSN